MKKNILITGSSGYLGSYLVNNLIKEGHNIIGIDIKKPKIKNRNFNFIKKKIINLKKKEIKNLDCIIHCGTISRNYSETSKLNFFDDLFGLYFLYQQIDKNTKFIFLSSIDIYKKKIKTDYQKFKTLSEQYLINLSKIKKFNLVIIRPSTFFSKEYPKKNIAIYKIKNSIKKNKNFYLTKGAPKLNVIDIKKLYELINKQLNQKKYKQKIYNLLSKRSYNYETVFKHFKKQNKSKSKLFYVASKKRKHVKLKEQNIILKDTLDSF